MAGIMDAAANVVGEVADYLKTEAEGLQRRKEQRQHEEEEARQRGEAPSESAPAAATDTPAAAADGSGDSLYGPEGLNATAPDIGRPEEGAAPGPGQREREREGEGEGGGLGDTLRSAQERISQEAQQVKGRFEEGFREARDRLAGDDEQQQQREPSTGAVGADEHSGGGGEDFQDTLREAKARLDDENEILKQRFREGYHGAMGQVE
ncbi:hypothetical protein PLESTB_000270200 [Pleodorina starrii]|uniref:Uncharacterized protein n=1 Tax=Pleodorina starrii TaxID=330485 RepID=A0A9W6BCN7_9CHLO|nr:hypothetical protein PLESTM_000684900 [Pleodorina starrii]GLC49639.1 hypothetical protein PLESTB_000270200 [Pleodorina starrii]GLC65580.1 hypothetical protein PLESTF_000315100 [Pleodorina starrii]